MKRLAGVHWPLAAAFLLLAAQQVIFLALFPPATEPDSAGYLNIAAQFLSSGSFPFEHRLPGYPAFLALLQFLFGPGFLPVVIVQHLLGLLVWFIFIKILETDRQKLVFSALYFCDLLYNSYQHAILADFFFSFLLCVSAWLAWLYRRDGNRVFLFLCGLLAGCAILTKPVLKLFPFFILPVFFLAGRRPFRSRLASAAVFLAAPLLLMNLWCYRNYRLEGSYSLLKMESYDYLGRAADFMEFPEHSVTAEFFRKRFSSAPLTRDTKAAAVLGAIADMKAAGVDTSALDAEFKSIVRLSVARHPFLYLKESGVELFYFFFSAHNLYAKFALRDAIPLSVEKGLRSGNLKGALLKFAVSLHPLYWAIFLLFVYYSVFNAIGLVREGDLFSLYLYGLIAYIALVSSMTNEGLARYRCAIQPFLLFFATLALDRLFRPREGDRP